jgi:hypothetical protein
MECEAKSGTFSMVFPLPNAGFTIPQTHQTVLLVNVGSLLPLVRSVWAVPSSSTKR